MTNNKIDNLKESLEQEREELQEQFESYKIKVVNDIQNASYENVLKINDSVNFCGMNRIALRLNEVEAKLRTVNYLIEE